MAFDIQCPREFAGKHYVAGGIYDGPLNDYALLTPDWDGRTTNAEGDAIYSSRWTVGYVYDAGRIVHVGCTYRDDTMRDFPLPQRIDACHSTSAANAPLKLHCQ